LKQNKQVKDGEIFGLSTMPPYKLNKKKDATISSKLDEQLRHIR